MQIKDFVKVFDVEIPDKILELIKENQGNMHQGITGNGEILDIRNCLEHYLPPQAYEHFSDSEKIVYNFFDKLNTKLIDRYLELFPEATDSIVKIHAGIHILKYDKDGKYVQHIDDFGRRAIRRLSVSVILNDDYKGGNFSFFNGKYTPTLTKNQAIVFPSSWMFPHQITPVTNGERWAVISWFI